MRINPAVDPDRRPVDPIGFGLGPLRLPPKHRALQASRLRASRVAREAPAQPLDVISRKLAD